jgi:hypothetical protein
MNKLQKRAVAQVEAVEKWMNSHASFVDGMNQRTKTEYCNDPDLEEPTLDILRRGLFYITRRPALTYRSFRLKRTTSRFEEQWLLENPGSSLPEEVGNLALKLSGIDGNEILARLDARFPS